MTELKTTTSNRWSVAQAFALSAFALLLGVCGGWLIRRSVAGKHAAKNAPIASASASDANSSVEAAPVNFGSAPTLPSPAELKQAADSQAVPLLEHLKGDPTNAGILAQIGNLYYDAKEYPSAIEYYERSLKSQPNDSAVRTDLGTAYWYKGDPDTAIAQFNRVLSAEPTKADTLFNLGVVKWQGKKDAQGAVAAWQKLLDTNPGYPNRENVLQLIAQAQGR